MNAYVGITDWTWFQQLRALPDLPEVNFWQPGGNRQFGALRAGELFLFKLHSPRNFIVGGGVFAHASLLPVSLAWKSFGEFNGAKTLDEMRRRIESYRRRPADNAEDYRVGCIALTQPFFFPEESWIAVPEDWHSNIVQGKTYDLEQPVGAALMGRVEVALQRMPGSLELAGAVHEARVTSAERYGKPILVLPRLGQGSFRMLIIDAYERRCAVTGERVLPVLEAAHVMPYARGGSHEVDNGLLLRSDLHALFDDGYVTITPEYRFEVSGRIKDEFENGKDYYALHGRLLRAPNRRFAAASTAHLEWHNDNIFKR